MSLRPHPIEDDVVGIISHKMTIITIFGHNHFRQKFHQKFDIFLEKTLNFDIFFTSRSTNMAADLNGRDSHFVFSLHVYQYSVEPSKKGGCGVIGGRSRLHLIDFGCCDRTKTSGGSITQSGLGNVILGT